MLRKSSMLQPLIKPFKGVLYNKTKIEDISLCVCPPYDVISHLRSYYEKSPYNAIRLELPVTRPLVSKYEAAKETMQEWLREDVLIFDSEETVYLYEQEFEVEGVRRIRRGLIPAIRLDKERILTHEKTRQEAREDRERLIGTLEMLTSLVFALYDDAENVVERFLSGAEKEKIFEFSDEASIKNRFYRMKDPAEMQTLASLLEDKNIYIADGHHRLSVLFKLGLPYAAMYLTNFYSDGIVILPYHRVVKLQDPRTSSDLLKKLKEGGAEIEAISVDGFAAVKKTLKRIDGSREPLYALYAHDDPSYLQLIRHHAAGIDGNGPAAVLKTLRVNILHEGIMKNLLTIKEEEISFLNSGEDTYQAVRAGQYDFAFFVPSTTVDEVKRVADNSLFMPPKSTFFYPKILTGLIFQKYA
jgi:uncharacterized protein (DUF1015 family)